MADASGSSTWRVRCTGIKCTNRRERCEVLTVHWRVVANNVCNEIVGSTLVVQAHLTIRTDTDSHEIGNNVARCEIQIRRERSSNTSRPNRDESSTSRVHCSHVHDDCCRIDGNAISSGDLKIKSATRRHPTCDTTRGVGGTSIENSDWRYWIEPCAHSVPTDRERLEHCSTLNLEKKGEFASVGLVALNRRSSSRLEVERAAGTLADFELKSGGAVRSDCGHGLVGICTRRAKCGRGALARNSRREVSGVINRPSGRGTLPSFDAVNETRPGGNRHGDGLTINETHRRRGCDIHRYGGCFSASWVESGNRKHIRHKSDDDAQVAKDSDL